MLDRLASRALTIAVLLGASTAAHATAITFQGDVAGSSVGPLTLINGTAGAGTPTIVLDPSFGTAFSAPPGTPVTETLLDITLPASTNAFQTATYTVSSTFAFIQPNGAPTVIKGAAEFYVQQTNTVTSDNYTWNLPNLMSYTDLAGDNYTIAFNNANNQSAPGALAVTATFTYVPEPASLALLGAGLAGLGLIRRRRRG